MKDEIIIMSDSPEAATLVTLKLPDGTEYGKGWVSINRRFYPNEAQARNDSATHHKCETCEAIIKKARYCEGCYHKISVAKYLCKPYKEYDGEKYLTLHDDDRFFYSEEDVREYCYENETLPENLMLVICEPNYLNTVDAEYWQDIFPEDSDGELPNEVEAALKSLNEVIKKQSPISWSGGKYRTTISNTVHVSDVEFELGNG